MFLRDFVTAGFKIFREKTSGVAPERKANQGFEVTDQSVVNGDYSVTNGGEEEGWLFLNKGSGRNIGSWVQACPAVYDSSAGTVLPMKNKTQTTDSDYATKTTSSSAGDSSSAVHIATVDGSKIPGIIVTCPNHSAQEQVFFPIATEVTIRYARIAWNFSYLEDQSEAELMTYNTTTHAFVASTNTIWIDSWMSLPNLVFETAGDATIFEVQKIGTAIRRSVTRDLYYAKKCISDEGTRYLSFQGLATYYNNSRAIDVRLMASETPWLTPELSVIKTSVGSKTRINNLSISLAKEWQGTGNPGHFKWARLQSHAPLLAAPVRPVLNNRDEKLFSDFNLLPNQQTISMYCAV